MSYITSHDWSDPEYPNRCRVCGEEVGLGSRSFCFDLVKRLREIEDKIDAHLKEPHNAPHEHVGLMQFGGLSR